MNEITLFLGEPISYWQELQRRAKDLDVTHLIKDLAEADGKVIYYERMLDRINDYRRIRALQTGESRP